MVEVSVMSALLYSILF